MQLLSFSTTRRVRLLLLLLLLLCSCQQRALGSNVGVAYGHDGNNLPSPPQVVRLLKANNVGKVHIYDTSKEVLEAFVGSGIDLIVGAPNELLNGLTSASTATNWVRDNIAPYAQSSKIVGIAVGNEVLTHDTQNTPYLYPAMVNVYNALGSFNLQSSIVVSTTHAFDVIDPSRGYPPSKGAFNGPIRSQMSNILNFLSQHNSPFYANVYPYFAYAKNEAQIPLSYALFQPGTDNNDNGLHYTNLFDAQVDTLIAALAEMGHDSIQLVVTESGWPHEGASAATINNAKTYTNNLISHVSKGTPRRPNTLITTYIFALFDENQKSSGIEQHFGLFNPDQTKVYDFTIS